MALTKTDAFLVLELGRRRQELKSKLDALPVDPRAVLQAEFDEVEAKLLSIDPTIKTLAEEAQLAEEAKALAAAPETLEEK